MELCTKICKELTLQSGVLLEKLTVTQLVNKFPAFYETRMFTTLITTFRTSLCPEPQLTNLVLQEPF